MSKLDKHNGLKEAHEILRAYNLELKAEHDALPSNFFGGTRPRHHELLHMSNALVELGKRLVAHGEKIVSER